MTPLRRYTFHMDSEQQAGLAKVKQRDGISESEQIRRAIALWLESKGIESKGPIPKADRKRASTRKRS